MIVRLGMAPRRAGMTSTDFQRHWRTSHADVVSTMPGLRRYVQLHAVLEDDVPLLPYPGFDACSALSFDDLAGMDAAFDSATFREAVTRDEQDFVDKRSFNGVIGSWHSELPSVDALGPVVLAQLWTCDAGVEPATVAEALVARQADPAHGLLVADRTAHSSRFAVGADVVELTGHAEVEQALETARASLPVRGATLGAQHLATPVVVTGDLPDLPEPRNERTT